MQPARSRSSANGRLLPSFGVILIAFSAVLLTIAFAGSDPESVPTPAVDQNAGLVAGYHLWDQPDNETGITNWPDWLTAWSYDGGMLLTNPPSWYVPEDTPAGVGSLYVVLDRTVLTNDLGVTLQLFDFAGSSLCLDLLSTNLGEVATNLYGNLLLGSDQYAGVALRLPLRSRPDASVIRLGRDFGEILLTGKNRGQTKE